MATLSTPVEVLLYVLVVLFVLAFAIFLGRCIHAAEEPIDPPAEPESAADLDDWLDGTAVVFDFELWERPVASTSLRRAA